jgi:hypothetical protein
MVVGCGQQAAPATLRGQPATYLLGVDQMVSPDFALDVPPHALTTADILATSGAAAAQLSAAGFVAAAGEDLFRSTGSLALTNGPVQVRDSVEVYASSSGAATVYGGDVTRLDAVRGAAAISTGALGDAAHATTMTATALDGTVVVEISVEWRVDNLVDILVVRGRNGATRLDDALLLAHRQTVTELGLSTPPARS